MRTAPSLTSYRRGSSEARLVLPDPDDPTSATVSPGSSTSDTSTSTSRSGSVPPNALGASSERTVTSAAAG